MPTTVSIPEEDFCCGTLPAAGRPAGAPEFGVGRRTGVRASDVSGSGEVLSAWATASTFAFGSADACTGRVERSTSCGFGDGAFAFDDFELGRFCTAGSSSGDGEAEVATGVGAGSSWARTPRAIRSITRRTTAAATAKSATAHSTIGHHVGR
jgi:hypothetical protein